MMYFIRLAYLFIIDSHGIVPFRMQTVMSRAPIATRAIFRRP